VKWTSSKKSVATVSSKGVVKAKKKGTATITAKVSGKKYTCKVTVLKSEKEIVSDNIKTLKKYINKNGTKNSDGNKYIMMTDSDIEEDIIYDKSADSLNFILYDSGSELTASMTISSSDNSKPIKFKLVCTSVKFTAKTTIYPSTHSEDKTYAFTTTKESSVITDSFIRKTGATYLKFSFLGWSILLLGETGLSLNDIGFTSY
jgi:hypothetical protein